MIAAWLHEELRRMEERLNGRLEQRLMQQEARFEQRLTRLEERLDVLTPLAVQSAILVAKVRSFRYTESFVLIACLRTRITCTETLLT